MTIYSRTKINYRKIYKEHFGSIPKGYHIHHKDGNHCNNDPSNLIAITAKEHYDIHFEQGDYGACWAMCRTGHMSLTSSERSELAKKQMKNPKMKKLLSESMKEKNKTLWKNSEFRERRLEKLSKNWKIVHPNGQIEIIRNLNSFCKTFGLTHQNMYAVAKGKQKHHKGFICKEIEKEGD